MHFCNFHIHMTNPLSDKPIKWSNTPTQFVGKLPMNCFECVWGLKHCQISMMKLLPGNIKGKMHLSMV